MKIRLMLSCAVLLLLAGSAMADPKISREFRVEAAAGSVQRVIVEIGVSELEIRNGPAGSIVAHGMVKREYESSEDIKKAQAILDQSDVEIEIDGSRAIIRRKLGRDADGWRVRNQTQFTVIVEIPVAVDVEVQQKVGEITVDGSFGNIDIDLGVGEVKIRTPKKNVREVSARARIGENRTHTGDRIITREGVLSGRTEFFNEGGTSRLHVAVGVGEIDIELIP